VTLADRITVMADFVIVGELDNDHAYDRMSQAIIRLIHAEPVLATAAASGARPAESGGVAASESPDGAA
jgi:hypothetical protein